MPMVGVIELPEGAARYRRASQRGVRRAGGAHDVDELVVGPGATGGMWRAAEVECVGLANGRRR